MISCNDCQEHLERGFFVECCADIDDYPSVLYISPDEDDVYKIDTTTPAYPHRIYVRCKSDLLAHKYLHQKTEGTPNFGSIDPSRQIYVEQDIAGHFIIH